MELPPGFASDRIIDDVRGINRVVYDNSGKPPATIEWEVRRRPITEGAAGRNERQGLRSPPR